MTSPNVTVIGARLPRQGQDVRRLACGVDSGCDVIVPWIHVFRWTLLFKQYGQQDSCTTQVMCRHVRIALSVVGGKRDGDACLEASVWFQWMCDILERLSRADDEGWGRTRVPI